MPWRVEIDCILDIPMDRAWALVRQPRTLTYISAPLLRFRPIDPPRWPEVWPKTEPETKPETESDTAPDGARAEEAPGVRYRVAMAFLGLVPMGRQWIVVSFPRAGAADPPGARLVRDNGSGDLVRMWDHWIIMVPRSDGRTEYRDRVDIAAGVLTPFIWAFAQVFYRWRQRRWRALCRREKAGGPA